MIWCTTQCSDILFWKHTEISDTNQIVWIGLTGVDKVFTNCASVLVLLMHGTNSTQICNGASPYLQEEADKLSPGYYAVEPLSILGTFYGLWPPGNELLQLFLHFKHFMASHMFDHL